jgi:hypothetical protein
MTESDSAKLRGFAATLVLCGIGSCFGTQCWPEIHKFVYKADFAEIARLDEQLNAKQQQYNAALTKAQETKKIVEATDLQLDKCDAELKELASHAKGNRLPEPQFTRWSTLREECLKLVETRRGWVATYEDQAKTLESQRLQFNALVTSRNAKAATSRLPSSFLIVPSH